MASTTATGDNDDSVTISFGCDYAKSSNAKCHGKFCENEIPKGTLRLSRLIPNPFIPQSTTREEQLMPVYYHVQCLINYLRSGKEKKKRIQNIEQDLQDFDQLKKRDQDKLKKLFSNEDKIQDNLSETSTTANTTYLEHDEEQKYWQISIDNKTTKTKYGLLNEPDSNAIILYKVFSSQLEANKYVQKKTQEKLRKHGYTLIKQTGVTTTNKQVSVATQRKRKQSPTPVTATTVKRTKIQRTTSVGTRKQPTRLASKKTK